MTDETATTAVPTEPLIEFLVAMAREVGDYRGTMTAPERGVESEIEWSWDDVDWELESYPDKQELVVIGNVEGGYGVKTARARYNPPGKAHPAEYEHRTTPLGIDIHVDMSDCDGLNFGAFTIDVQLL